jgi:superfamily II DNA or RNA helicase
LIQLRPYQLDGERQIRQAFADGFKSVLYVLSTGGGKTYLFASIAFSAMRRAKRVLILCHRIELVDQIIDALKAFDITPQIIAASYQASAGSARAANKAVAVASVQTLIRRLDSYAAPTLIITDEAHHCAGGNSWSQILRKWPEARILGVTATPCRLDSRGLGAHFDKLILGPSEEELVNRGYLVRTRIFAPPLVDTSGLFAPGHIRAGDCKADEADALVNTPAVTGDAFSEYMKHTPHEQGLVFCTGVQHAENIAKRFRDGGVAAVSLNGGMDKQIRRMAFEDYRRGAIRILTSMDIFSEGVDAPGARVGIMLRPTQSLTLYRQQRGRILRPFPGKEYGTLIDHVQNCEKPGFVLLPGESDNWELTPDFIKKKKDVKPGIRVCLKCFAASPAYAKACGECGAVFPIKAREELEHREGELVELTPEELARKRERREQGQATLQQLRDIERLKHYKPGWADHVYAGRMAKKLRKESA